MTRVLLILSVFLAGPAWAQEAAPEATPEAAPEAAPEAQGEAEAPSAEAQPAAAAKEPEQPAVDLQRLKAQLKLELLEELSAGRSSGAGVPADWEEKVLKETIKPALRTLELKGYLRTRMDYMRNLDLGTAQFNRDTGGWLGSSNVPPSLFWNGEGNSELSSANMRWRLDPTLNLSETVQIHARVDVFDNVILGATPDAYPGLVLNSSSPVAVFSASSNPPQPGVNGPWSGLAIKRVYGDVLLPFVLGGAVAYFLDPLADRLERMGASRALATGIITVCAVLIFVILALAVIPALIRQTIALFDIAPQLFRNLQAFLTERFPSLMDEGSALRETLISVGETIRDRGAALLEPACRPRVPTPRLTATADDAALDFPEPLTERQRIARAADFGLRVLPVIGSYLSLYTQLGLKEKIFNQCLSDEECEVVWDEQHERGSAVLSDAINDLKGFYTKTGQIIASRQDLFPKQYIDALAGLTDLHAHVDDARCDEGAARIHAVGIIDLRHGRVEDLRDAAALDQQGAGGGAVGLRVDQHGVEDEGLLGHAGCPVARWQACFRAARRR